MSSPKENVARLLWVKSRRNKHFKTFESSVLNLTKTTSTRETGEAFFGDKNLIYKMSSRREKNFSLSVIDDSLLTTSVLFLYK